jgi:hypothetical protein
VKSVRKPGREDKDSFSDEANKATTTSPRMDRGSDSGSEVRHGDEDDSDERSEESSDDDGEFFWFGVNLQRIKENDPLTKKLAGVGRDERIQNMTEECWEEIGRDISNNTHLENVYLHEGALNDHKMSFLFRGLMRSTSSKDMSLNENGLSVEGIRSMVPFLQNANNLKHLHLDHNNIQSEGINLLFRSLRDSQIQYLSCDNSGIDSIDIDRNNIPQNLVYLCLDGNNINADGCRELTKLLQGEDATLSILGLRDNNIDDEGVEILVDALRNNTSLESLGLNGNHDISYQGKIMLLKLVNDVSSIHATLQSNQTLTYLCVKDINPYDPDELLDADDEIQTHINVATEIHEHFYTPESVGREKVIASHLDSQNRAELYRLQDVDHSVYSEINPLHLPEVLSLIGDRHGEGELYAALSSSIMMLFSTVNRKKCIQQEKNYHADTIAKHVAIIAEHRAKVEELDAELGVIESAEGGNEDYEIIEHRSNKRRRKWWWGLWG